MNRINQLFNSNKKDLLSIYFCAGDPTLDGTADVIRTLEKHGVSMIEVGIPFSDPMADGIVIQNAATQALRNGMSLKVLFEQLRNIRRDVKIPLVLMGYLNPIMQFGFENFCRKCVECGIDGVIIPDLPFHDYQERYRIIAERYGIKVIMLITPETSEERVREIDAHTDGFIYMVSSAATTGAQQDFNEQKRLYFKKIEDMHLKNPLMVGFGISNKATFQAACEHASGAIIGSRFVTLLEEEKDPEKAILKLKEAGFTELVINIHHFGEQIIDFLKANQNFGLTIHISDERDRLLDTGGGIKKAATFFTGTEPFLVHNVDILSNADLKEVYDFHRKSQNLATLLVSPRKTSRHLLFDTDNRLQGWIHKDTLQTKPEGFVYEPGQYREYAFSGIHVISPELFHYMDGEAWKGKFPIMDFYLHTCQQLQLGGCIKEDLQLIDIGKPDTLARAEEFLKD